MQAPRSKQHQMYPLPTVRHGHVYAGPSKREYAIRATPHGSNAWGRRPRYVPSGEIWQLTDVNFRKAVSLERLVVAFGQGSP